MSVWRQKLFQTRNGPPQPRRFRALADLYLRAVDAWIPAAIQAGDSELLRRARIVVSFTLALVVLGIEAIVFFHFDEFGVDPGLLEIEITENSMMADEIDASRSLRELRDLGVRIALDDFGTGYSSLSYIRRFPVHSLKIDRTFVAEITTAKEAEAIAKAIIELAHGLQLKVVAEGIETKAQERFLIEHGCDELQGFRFGEPVPADEVLRSIGAGASERGGDR